MSDLVPDELENDARGNEPIGLAAALRERQASANAAQAEDEGRTDIGGPGAPGAPGAAPMASDPGLEHRALIEGALFYLDSWMAGWCPGFTPPSGPMRQATIDAACAVAAKYSVPNAPPEIVLAGCLVFAYGPPLVVGFKLRAKAKRERDARPPDPEG